MTSPSHHTIYPTTYKADTALFVFDVPLQLHEVKYFRGAVGKLAGVTAQLIHGHNPFEQMDNVHGYPKVQFRSHNGYAAIFAMNEGITAVNQRVLPKLQHLKIFKIQHKEVFLMHVHEVQNCLLQLQHQMLNYQLNQAFLLNHKNHKKWLSLRGGSLQKRELERIIVAHLFSIGKRLGWTITQNRNLHLEVEQFRVKQYHEKIKEVQPFIFDVRLRCNVSLPNFMGIGKMVSHGFGSLQQISKRH